MYLPSFSNVYVVVFTANLLMFIAGTALTWSSPVLPKLVSAHPKHRIFDTPISIDQATWISSLVTLGAAAGPFLFGWLTNRVGRKPTLLYLGVPFLLSFAMLAFGSNVEMYYVARFICGIAVGGTLTVLPIYISEISPPAQLGRLSSLMGCFCCLGLFFSVCVGTFLDIRIFNLVLAIVPCAYLIAFCWAAPESPAYLYQIGEEQLAREVFTKMGRTKEELEKEIGDLEGAGKENERENVSVLDIFRSKGMIKALVISVGLMVFQQFSGINAVLFYSQRIFRESETKLAPEYCTMIVVGVQFLSSFLTPVIADKYGRRIILSCSTIGMAISEVPLGVYCYLKSHSFNMGAFSLLPLVSLTAFIIFFNIGIGPLPWLVVCEVFPTCLKSFSTALVSTVIWLLSFVVTKYFGQAVKLFGLGEMFMFFAVCCVIATIFVLGYVVETKGKNYSQIQEELSK